MYEDIDAGRDSRPGNLLYNHIANSVAEHLATATATATATQWRAAPGVADERPLCREDSTPTGCASHTTLHELSFRHPVRERATTTAAHVDSVRSDGRTWLSMASTDSNLEAAELLIGCKADPNQMVSVHGGDAVVSPLHEASHHGHAEMVALLLKHNARVDQADADNNSPLLLAASNQSQAPRSTCWLCTHGFLFLVSALKS